MTSRAALSAFGIGVFAATSLTFAAAQQARPAGFISRAAEALGTRPAMRLESSSVVPQNISFTPSWICLGGPADVI